MHSTHTYPAACDMSPRSIRDSDETFCTGESTTFFTGESDVWSALECFGNDCENAHCLYPFELEVVRVFELKNSSLERRFCHIGDKLHSRGPNIKQLYHGTSWDFARSIIRDGFKIPK